MYKFIDVIESSEEIALPSEALMINGEYIENLIEGYRTLSVTGREALSPDVVTFTTGVRDGSRMQTKRYPERIITVQYQLIAESNEAFRTAYNKLGGILNVTDAQLIFNDELDKYYTGTPCIIDEVEPGRNAVVGKFEILCTDPFKYSLAEYEAYPEEGTTQFALWYDGTYKSFPKLVTTFADETEVAADGETANTLTGNGDCGYVAFFNENEKIIQLGDPDEVDGVVAYEKSQTLINQTFKDSTSWGTTAKALWSVNNGVVMPHDVKQLGTVGMAKASETTSVNTGKTSGHLGTVAASQSSYKATFSTSNRTATSVTVAVTVQASLAATLTSARLSVMVTVAGVTRSIYLTAGSSWRVGTASFTISGLTASQTAITGNSLSATAYTSAGNTVALGGGSLGSVTISAYSTSTYATYYMTATDYGNASGWHGASITRAIGADAAGEVGAANFTLTYEQKFCIANTSAGINQLGGFHCHLSAADGTVVAGVRISKNQLGSKACSLMLYVNGEKVHQVSLDAAYNNPYFGASSNSVNTSTIKKEGGKIMFTIGGYSQTFTDEDIADKKVVNVTFMFEANDTYTPLTYNGLFWAKFVKNNCNTMRDIPNKFSANDVLVADCSSGEIYLNNVHSPELGALGNDWEEFYLTPGINQIGYSYSNWVAEAYAPSVILRYREVFL